MWNHETNNFYNYIFEIKTGIFETDNEAELLKRIGFIVGKKRLDFSRKVQHIFKLEFLHVLVTMSLQNKAAGTYILKEMCNFD